jgi:hypothetical protein
MRFRYSFTAVESREAAAPCQSRSCNRSGKPGASGAQCVIRKVPFPAPLYPATLSIYSENAAHDPNDSSPLLSTPSDLAHRGYCPCSEQTRGSRLPNRRASNRSKRVPGMVGLFAELTSMDRKNRGKASVHGRLWMATSDLGEQLRRVQVHSRSCADRSGFTANHRGWRRNVVGHSAESHPCCLYTPKPHAGSRYQSSGC